MTAAEVVKKIRKEGRADLLQKVLYKEMTYSEAAEELGIDDVANDIKEHDIVCCIKSIMGEVFQKAETEEYEDVN